MREATKTGRCFKGLLFSVLIFVSGVSFAGASPNIVLILIDDLGWSDLACYGNKIVSTPHVDRLASQGMLFTDAYAAAPVCSPTRAALLTGKYPAALGLTDFIPGHLRPYARLLPPHFKQALPLEELTIAEALKEAGYATAIFGKWHLGGRRFGPTRQGFDLYVGRGENRNDKQVTALTEAAVTFIDRNRSRPFFLFLSHYTVHIPLEAPHALVDKYRRKLAAAPYPMHPAYAAMVEHMDWSVGQVLAALSRCGLTEKTLVIFTSDNGGLIRMYTGKGPAVTSNAPLRSEKGSLYEGGIRVPLIIKYPPLVPSGSKCSVPVSSIDIFPTCLQVAGAKLPKAVDGVSLVPLLGGRSALKRKALYWHYPHYHHTSPCSAVRKENFKLIEYFEDGHLELYDLRKDLSEKNNLVRSLPQRAEALRAELQEWRREVGAALPRLNPAYDPARAGVWGKRTKKTQRKP